MFKLHGTVFPVDFVPLKILYKMKIIHLVHDSIVPEKLYTFMWTAFYI